MQKKLVLLFAGIVLAFALLVGRITYINAFNGDKYSKIVLDQQQYQSRTIPFKRGDIVERNGHEACNKPASIQCDSGCKGHEQ